MKVKMLIDTKGENGEMLYSGGVFKVSEQFGNKLIMFGKAYLYTPIKRIPSSEKKYVVDGVFMTLSELRKLKGIRMY